LAEATTEWETTPGEHWLDRYGPDIDEVRAALQWAFGPQGDAALGIDLIANSHIIWGELGLTFEHRQWVQIALTHTNDTTPRKVIARLLSWHAGDVKNIDDPTDYDDAMRAAELHAQLGDSFAEGQALLRAGSGRLFPAKNDGGEALLRKAHKLLAPFGATKSLARCLSALASSCLLAGDLAQARQLHNQALSLSQKTSAETTGESGR
jgi:hypothetical protein